MLPLSAPPSGWAGEFFLSLHGQARIVMVQWKNYFRSQYNKGPSLLSVSFHSLLSYRVSVEDQLLALWGPPSMLFVAFSLLLFNIYSLCLIFVSLINIKLVLVCFSLGLSCMKLSGLPGSGSLFPFPF